MPELLIPVDADYNSDSRRILAKIDIHFSSGILTVTKDDYLVFMDILEELGSDAENNPIGKVSVNEFSFELFNENGIFSPSNPNSPYFGEMKKGVLVIPFFRTSTTQWIKMGEFYVDDWLAVVTGFQVNVICVDDINRVFSIEPPKPQAIADVTYQYAFEQFFSAISTPAEIDETLVNQLSWWYTLNNNMDTLQNLSGAALAACFCGRDGGIKVRNMALTKPLRATLTDHNQITSANITQSINKQFDGAIVQLNKHQVSNTQELLNIREYPVPVGIHESPIFTFSNAPVIRIEVAKIEEPESFVRYITHLANLYNIVFTLENLSAVERNIALTFFGRKLEIINSTYFKSGINSLSFDNVYLQQEVQAELVTDLLTRFTDDDLPFIDIEVRGNPLLQLGDKINIQSAKYGINFTGYIQRQQFVYTGALRGSIRLINHRVLEVLV